MKRALKWIGIGLGGLVGLLVLGLARPHPQPRESPRDIRPARPQPSGESLRRPASLALRIACARSETCSLLRIVET